MFNCHLVTGKLLVEAISCYHAVRSAKNNDCKYTVVGLIL